MSACTVIRPGPLIDGSGRDPIPPAVVIVGGERPCDPGGGTTSVRDAGANYGIHAGLKRAINEGLVPRPRMVVGGRGLSITGGHGDPAP